MKIIPTKVSLKNGISLSLRSPEPEEAQLLLDHLAISHTESWQNLDRTGDSWRDFPLEKEKEIIEGFSRAENKFFVSAFTDGKIVGGLGISGDLRPFRLHSATLGMSIQKAYQNIGLGSALMTTALEEAQKIGLHRIELTVRDYNLAGITLYEKFGFERVGSLKDAAKIDGKFVNEFFYQLIL